MRIRVRTHWGVVDMVVPPPVRTDDEGGYDWVRTWGLVRSG